MALRPIVIPMKNNTVAVSLGYANSKTRNMELEKTARLPLTVELYLVIREMMTKKFLLATIRHEDFGAAVMVGLLLAVILIAAQIRYQ